jgi:hypothetical protein
LKNELIKIYLIKVQMAENVSEVPIDENLTERPEELDVIRREVSDIVVRVFADDPAENGQQMREIVNGEQQENHSPIDFGTILDRTSEMIRLLIGNDINNPEFTEVNNMMARMRATNDKAGNVAIQNAEDFVRIFREGLNIV